MQYFVCIVLVLKYMTYGVQREIKEMEIYFFCSNENTQSHITSRARMRDYIKL